MSYTEAIHLKDKQPIVTKIYERLINELQKFGHLKLNQKKQAFIWETILALQEFIPERIILI